jgi:uroporphyrinogen III methyltransferase / synthase
LGTGSQSLAGKRIVVTRAPEQASAFVRALEEAGAEVITLPCVDFSPPEDWNAVDSALARLSEFNWIVFTGQNAVRFYSQRARERNLALPRSRVLGPKIAALGSATAEAARREDMTPDFVAAAARSGSEFVAEFALLARGATILLPVSDQAGVRIAEALRATGADVTSVVAYRTCMPKSLNSDALARIRENGVDLIFFASPSAFRNFAGTLTADALSWFVDNSAFGAIGPTTAQAIREVGVPVGFESPQPDTNSIMKTMTEYFASKNQESSRI